MLSSEDCSVGRGNLQSRHGDNALYDHERWFPCACNESSEAKRANLHNKLWLTSSMEEQSPSVSCDHMSYAKMKSMPVDGYANYPGEEDDCSGTTIPLIDCPSSQVKDTDNRDAIVAACHLLLLSNSFQTEKRGWDSYADGMLRDKYFKAVRDPFEEDSDSFTPASLTSAASPSSNDCRSYGSASHDNIGTESSSMVTDTEVTSDSNAPVRKRKKTNGRLLADIVGQEKESEVLDRPARKRRYRSLSELLRQLG